MVIAYFATYTVNGDYEANKPNEHGALITDVPECFNPFFVASGDAAHYGDTINEQLISLELMEVTKDAEIH